MKSHVKYWNEMYPDYWVNEVSGYVVTEVGKDERDEWVILNQAMMMMSCEYRPEKEVLPATDCKIW